MLTNHILQNKCSECLSDPTTLKPLSIIYLVLSHRHVTEPWPSARRATARRSPDRILVAGVEI
eukprot:1161825-Pelagomonas_calceolata.AAC.12